MLFIFLFSDKIVHLYDISLDIINMVYLFIYFSCLKLINLKGWIINTIFKVLGPITLLNFQKIVFIT